MSNPVCRLLEEERFRGVRTVDEGCQGTAKRLDTSGADVVIREQKPSPGGDSIGVMAGAAPGILQDDIGALFKRHVTALPAENGGQERGDGETAEQSRLLTYAPVMIAAPV